MYIKGKKNQIIPFYQIKKPSKHTAVYNYNNELTKNRKKQTEEPVLRKKYTFGIQVQTVKSRC